MVPPLVKLALDYYRAPLAYGHLSDVSRPLPRGFTKLLTEFGAALSGPRIEETAAALSTDVDELQEAARFFARHALLSPAGDYYRYLGLARNASADAVRAHYQLLIRMFHPDRLANASEADLAYSSRLNAAYRVLRDPEARARYDEQLPALSSRPRRGDLAAFFQPHQAELRVERPRLWQPVGNLLRRPVVAVPMAGVLMVGVALLLTRSQTSSALRVLKPVEGVQVRPLPRYLQRGAEPKGNAVIVSRAAGPERAVEKPVEGAAERLSASAVNRQAEAPAPWSPDGSAALSASDLADWGAVLESVGPPADEVAAAPAAAQPVEPRLEERFALAMEAGAAEAAARREEARRKAAEAEAAEARRRLLAAEQAREAAEARAREAERAAAEKAAAERGASPDQVARSSPAAGSGPGARAAAPAAVQVDPAAVGVRLMGQLQSAYQRGDADALARLFTRDARTSDGSGKWLIRAQYARAFADFEAQRISVEGMRWRSSGNGRVQGVGRVSVAARKRSGGAWLRSSGQIELELVPAGGGHLISVMLYRLN